jgi:hypothetical protein
MNKKYEKITLITAIDSFGNMKGVSALDEILSVVREHGTEVTILDYENGIDLELKEVKEVSNE